MPDDEEVSVSMTKKQWQSVLESFEAMPYPEDWADDGTLADKGEEAIRQKLIVAGR